MKNTPATSRRDAANTAASAGARCGVKGKNRGAESGFVTPKQLAAEIDRGYHYFWKKRAQVGVFCGEFSMGDAR